jgi:predicted glycosyltransferase
MLGLRNRFYYRIKPLIPARVRTAIRRRVASRLRPRVTDTWPIMPGSEQPPPDWSGWPEGKKFAVVLTHDIESEAGLLNCRKLMHVEMELGFRSSFNFVPEGTYSVSRELRDELTNNGFEIGIHDLRHDGRLYKSRTEFSRDAARISAYARDWGAVGFRSGFMMHNLAWLHDLDVDYDASTFDTDPFEPQPEGRHTIFPFWVPRPVAGPLTANHSRTGYVELPYTLPQDSTLFLMLGEKTIDIWKRKLDWVAEHGGMVLLDTHPDYMEMNGSPGKDARYPVSLYRELLLYINERYRGQFWHALPRSLSSFVYASLPEPERKPLTRSVSQSKPKSKIWIDLDNTPHVPFFEPILEELAARGFPLVVTARDAFQVCELADMKRLHYVKVGRHHGKNRFLKGVGLVGRAAQLSHVIARSGVALGVSHGSRSQLLLSNWLRIPTVLIEDYEYSQFPLMMRPSWVIAPHAIPEAELMLKNGHVRRYPGIKEDVYAWKLTPQPNILKELGLSDSDVIVTVRPPATEAHYHNPESEILFERFMNNASRTAGVKMILLPRNHKQEKVIRRQGPLWFENGKTIIPQGAIDGLNLLWYSDLVVSGGGTMNREAAALGVPVYSIFRGAIGAVDRYLSGEGRLVLISSAEDVDQKISLVKRRRAEAWTGTSKATLNSIVDAIIEIAEQSVPD